VTWCVFGSANAALRGFEADPDDVDVLTTEAGAKRIQDAFEDAFVGSYEVGVSRVDEYRTRGEELEVVYSEDGTSHQEPLVDLDDVGIDHAAGDGIPLLSLPGMVEAYRAMGRHEAATSLEAAAGED
jgi:hypothetical protein